MKINFDFSSNRTVLNNEIFEDIYQSFLSNKSYFEESVADFLHESESNPTFGQY
jgi:hypothetical protein